MRLFGRFVWYVNHVRDHFIDGYGFGFGIILGLWLRLFEFDLFNDF